MSEAQAMIDVVASRLSDPVEIRKSRQMPYQFFSAALHADAALPAAISAALNRAAEIACDNAPVFCGPVVVGLDVSGSMASPITGHQEGRSTKMRCIDAAALLAAAVLRRNPGSLIIPFDERTYRVAIAPDEPINDLARRLAAYGGGGTNCALPLEYVNTHFSHRAYAGCVLVSDNESWVGCGRYGATGVMDAWRTFVGHQARNHPAEFDGPKLVCLDLAPGATTQAAEASDVLNVGGFSDAVFGIIADFINGEDARFVAEIEAIEL